MEKGFSEGFDIGYRGPTNRQSNSKNIPLKVGSEVVLWNKIIKEVKLGRVAGPFNGSLPFEHYIQSPIGLVPKAGNSGKTRLIFHLSYDFGDNEDNKSLNKHTPHELCTVKYNDLDHAVTNCLSALNEVKQVLQRKKESDLVNQVSNILFQEVMEETIFLGKNDVQSAFRLVPLSFLCWPWLVMMARNHSTRVWQYFIDKCLPFGASISCAIFQRFSNVLCHITKVLSGRSSITNYLDDFLFVASAKSMCNLMIQNFLDIYYRVGVPIADEKTEWAVSVLVFLGILLNGKLMSLGIPEEKCQRAIYLLSKLVDKKKATVKEIQQLCGYLNFLNKAVYPGRPYMRRMYAKYAAICEKNNANHTNEVNPKQLKLYHHIRLDKEFKQDCKIWLSFLSDPKLKNVVHRPMIDLNQFATSDQIHFYTDASAAKKLGYGCVYGTKWAYGQWESDFIQVHKPSIEFLELYALCVGLLTWETYLSNCRIIIHCDNTAVVNMVNNLASKCEKCMKLIRILTLNGLTFNRRVSVKYIKSADNNLADALSQLDLKRFRRDRPFMNKTPNSISPVLQSAQSIFTAEL